MSHLITLLSPPRVYVKDGFNRADNASSMGNANTGQTWSTLSGTCGISSNQAYTSAGTGKAVLDSGASSGISVQCSLSVSAGDQRLIFRHSNTSNEWLIIRSATQYDLFKRVSGSLTNAGTYTTTPANGDRFVIELRGSSIIVRLNGTVIFNISDSFNQTATLCGIQTGDTSARFDNFVVEALS